MGYLPRVFDGLWQSEGGRFPNLEILLPNIDVSPEVESKRTRASRGGEFVVNTLAKALPANSLQFRHLVVFVAYHETLVSR